MISSDLSDEQVLYQRGKWEVSERVIEPLEMSDTEILDWLGEYAHLLKLDDVWWGVYFDCQRLVDLNIRSVVSRAAAYHKEYNQ